MSKVQRWRGLDATPAGWGRCVVTIGVYDGVHRGHQQIIARAVACAHGSGLPAVLLTFDPHPSEVVRPGTHPAVLTTTRYRAELVEKLGVDVLCVLPFTLEFSRLEPAEFAHTVLVEHLHAAAVVVGENFRFGHKAAGTVSVLRDLGRAFGFAVEGVGLLDTGGLDNNGGQLAAISSTYIRSCVAAGDVTAAATALTRPHRVEGVVVRGDRRGRELGYPTANVEPSTYAAIPADGVYAGWLAHPGRGSAAGRREGRAAISIGTNPTFAGRERRVEAYVLDAAADLDLYGEHVGLDFHSRLRPTVPFASAAALVEQMGRDVAQVRARLSSG